jgi:hypothetical protein
MGGYLRGNQIAGNGQYPEKIICFNLSPKDHEDCQTDKQSTKMKSEIPGTTSEYIGKFVFESPAAQFLIYRKMSAT